MSGLLEYQGQYYILASSSVADVASSVLKHGDTFAIFDRHGDIRPLGFETQGLFHEGTRFISRLKLEVNGKSPLLLSSNVREDNDLLVTDLTNPDLETPDTIIRSGTVHLIRTIFLWQGCCFERIEISNFGLQRIAFNLAFAYQADFVDLFEVRGNVRPKRGETFPVTTSDHTVSFGYRGLDGVVRRTELQFGQHASEINGGRAEFPIELNPQERRTFDLRIACHVGPAELASSEPFDAAFQKVRECYEEYRGNLAVLESSNAQFNEWIQQSQADLHMLLTRIGSSVYPFAGIPWFSCPFGRDGIITALEMLWIDPEIARGVLGHLASWQASEVVAEQDAEPGKILHEQRKGEMAALGEIPFGCYYGSIDSTPLFIVLAGRYYERTGDMEFVAKLWPHVERALEWIDRYGDSDGDGFVEYCKRGERGLVNQGWKDSEDSVFHADGSLAEPPIALCEVQGYVYEAKIVAAKLAQVLGFADTAGRLQREAVLLRENFHRAFWCEDLGFYALALDGEKRPCRVRSSNAGHCLFSGIASAEHAARIAAGLLSERFFSGWGIRTIPTDEPRYNPMSYHNGSIWPHDNALIAFGLMRYGYTGEALRVMCALFDASVFMPLSRLPELYCGFPRRVGEGPTLYPVACNPQAWASASVFFLIQTCLGLKMDASQSRMHFERPILPEALSSMDIKGLKLPSGSVDLHLQRLTEGVAVSIRKRTGTVSVIVVN